VAAMTELLKQHGVANALAPMPGQAFENV